MVRSIAEIESDLAASSKARSLAEIESDVHNRTTFAAGIDRTLMDERIKQFVSEDLDEDTKYKIANSLYMSTTYKQPFEDVYDNYDGIIDNLHLGDKSPKDLFEQIQWQNMTEKQRFAAYDKTTSFWQKAKDYKERTGTRMIKSLAGIVEASSDLSLRLQSKLTGGKVSPLTSMSRDWSVVMREAVQLHAKENPRMYINPAGGGFLDTTKEYIENPEYILFGVAEQVPWLMASLVTGGTTGGVAAAAGATAKTVKTAAWLGRVEGFAIPLFGERYSDLRSEGIAPEAAFAEAFLAAQAEGLLEEWTLMFNIGLFKGPGSVAKRGMSNYVAKWLLDKPWLVRAGAFAALTYGQGASEEGLQAVSDNFWAMVFRDVDTGLLDNVGQQAAAGGLLELAMGSGFKMGGKLFNPSYVSTEEQLARLDVIRDTIEKVPIPIERKQEIRTALGNVETSINEGKWTTEKPEIKPAEGKIYKGKAYRAETNLMAGGKTAADVVRFERDELGNVDDFRHISEEKLAELEKIPARDIVWVTRTKEAAAKYGIEGSREPTAKEIETIPEDYTDIVQGGEIITDLGEDGVLVLKPTSQPPAQAKPEFKANLKKLEQTLEEEFGAKLLLQETKKGDIKLDHIEVPGEKRQQGIGTNIMKRIIDFADKAGKRIVLYPAIKTDDFGTTSKSRLIKFYKRFGFVENKGRNRELEINDTMYRNPAPAQAEKQLAIETDETGIPESVEPAKEEVFDPVKRTERYSIQESDGKWIVKDWETQKEVSVHKNSKSALKESIALNKGEIEEKKYRFPLPPSDKKPMTIRQVLNYVMKGMERASKDAYMTAAKETVKNTKNLARFSQWLLKDIPIRESERNRLMNYIANSRTPTQKANALAIIQKVRDDALKRQAVIELKKVIAYINKSANRNMYQKGLRPEYYEKIQAIVEGITTKKITAKMRSRIKSLADYLDRVRVQAQSKYEVAYIESQIPENLINKVRALEPKHTDNMSINEILDVIRTLRQLIHLNNLKTELIMQRRAKGVADMLDSAIEESGNLKERPKFESADFSARQHKDGIFAKIANYFVGNKNHDIETLAETISGGHHTTIHTVLSENISQGREKEAGFLSEWDDMQRKTFEKNGIDLETLQDFSDAFFQTVKDPELRKKLGLKPAKRYRVTIGDKQVDMTMAELMSIYMHAQHLDFNFPEMMKSGVASKEGPVGKITVSDIEKISDIVEANPKAVALCNMAKELFEMSGDRINEISMLLDGIEIAKVIGYWPVKRYSSGGVAGRQEFRISLLEMMSFLQEREGSERPIVIRDFFETLTASQQGIAEYYGMAMPLRTIKNLLNYRPFRDMIINKKGYGEELRLVDVMIERLEQKPHPYSETDKYIKMMLSGLTRSVLANPGIMAGQYTSVMGYFTEADIKYISALRVLPDKQTTEKYKKIWNLYRRRAEGGISSVAIYDALQADALLRAYTEKKEYANYLTQGIHYVDILAITEAGRITEAEMKDKNLSGKSLEYWTLEGIDPTTLKEGTQEWNEAFVKRANYLVRRTQPMFFTENRSVLTSAETTLEKSLYLFRSYIDQPLRMFYRAINDYRNGRISQKSLIAQYSTVIAGLTFYEIIRFAIRKILTDTDEDETDLILRTLVSPLRIINLIGYPAAETIKSFMASKAKDEPMKWNLPDIQPLPLQFINDTIKGGTKISRGISYLDTNERFQSGPRKGKLKSEEYTKEGVEDIIMLGLKLLGVPAWIMYRLTKKKEEEKEKIKIGD